MNTASARRLDGLLRPLVRGLAGWPDPASITPLAAAALQPLAAPPDGPVLVIKLVGLGSLMLLAPAVSAFAQATGRPIALVTLAANRPLLALLDWPVQPVYLRSQATAVLAWDTLRQGRALRRRRPAAVVDLEFHSAFTTLFGRVLKPRRHLFLDAAWRRGPGAEPLQPPPEQHVADFTREVFTALAGQTLAVDPAPRFALVRLPDAAPRRVGTHRVVVNPNAGVMCLERRLPLEVFRETILGVAAAVPVEFHLIGDRREQAYTARLAAALPSGVTVTNHAGRLDLPGLLALLRSADLLISNDTGPMHVAAALGTPVLAAFGPESPVRYGPRGSRCTLIWGRLACGPCLNAGNRKTAPCHGDNRCLQQLTAADLLPAALDLLHGGAGEGAREIGPRVLPPVPDRPA